MTLVSYTRVSDKAMLDSHEGMGITREEFDEWVNIYRQTLKESGISDVDVHYIVDILSSYKSVIVSEN